MIKPSHYDDEGYPIQWRQSLIPSNSLACVNGLALDCDQRQILGPDVDINLVAIDETNRRIPHKKLIRMVQRDGGKALVALVGVQTNQFPRSVDMAQHYLQAGIPVCIGGFHVSGCLSMLPDTPPEIQAAMDQGISLFLGEAEGQRLDEVIQDAWGGKLKPKYDYLNDLPGISGEPIPILSDATIHRTMNTFSSFDVGRGCPYLCTFCTIINVHGRTSRFRSGEDLERIILENNAQNVRQFFITDDNLARNQNWEELFDTLIRIRKEKGIDLRLSIQVDTLCHKIKNFIPKAVAAGVDMVFVGLENINADNLVAAGKSQNRITDYREMLLEWKKYPVMISAGYIIGFPHDTRESLLHDVEIIKRELPIDNIYFTNLTPLPGSADHVRMHKAGEWMDPDLNKYDLNHRVTHHMKMTDEEWDQTYHDLWKRYYSWEHMTTVQKRVYGIGSNKKKATVHRMAWYHYFPIQLGVHPLEGGWVRIRSRLDRRPGFKIENPLIFYPKYWLRECMAMLTFGWIVLRLHRIRLRIEKDPMRHEYRDAAITPVAEQDFTSMDLYQDTRGGKEAVAKQAAKIARKQGKKAASQHAAA